MSTENSWCAVSHPKNNGYEKVTTEINIVTEDGCASSIWYDKEGKPTEREHDNMISVLGHKDWVKYLPVEKDGELDTSNCLVSIRRVIVGGFFEQKFYTQDFKYFQTFEGNKLEDYELSDFIEGNIPHYLFSGKYWEGKIQSIAENFPNAISIDWSFVDTTSDEKLVQ